MFGWFKKLFTGEVVDAINDSFEPAVSQAIVESKKEEVVFEDYPDFEMMTKAQIAEWAEAKDIKLDRRKKKETMISELINHLNKEK